jgi:hypothetical protein
MGLRMATDFGGIREALGAAGHWYGDGEIDFESFSKTEER